MGPVPAWSPLPPSLQPHTGLLASGPLHMLFPLLEAFPQVWTGLAFSSRSSWVAFLSLVLLDSEGFFPAAGMVQVPVSEVSFPPSPPIPTLHTLRAALFICRLTVLPQQHGILCKGEAPCPSVSPPRAQGLAHLLGP